MPITNHSNASNDSKSISSILKEHNIEMKIVFLMIGCCLLPLTGLTQDQIAARDSTQLSPELYFKLLAEKFSQTRKLDISYSSVGSTNFRTYLKENYIGKNTVDHTQEVRINLNLNLVQKQRWKLTSSWYYNYQGYHYDQARSDRQNP